MKYAIEQITALIGARRFGSRGAQVGFLLTDSRSLCFPEETLFFALTTTRNDGHRYIPELYRRGVRNFVISQREVVGEQYADANFLVVDNTLTALQRLAERHRDEFDIPIVGITGSNGKTVVKEWLYQVLRENPVQGSSLAITRSPRSYNSQIGVPLSVWLLGEKSRVGIFEAGISQPGEMETLHDIIQPTIGVLTHIGPAHQENFRSIEEKCMEKMQLFRDAEAVVYCTDDEVVSHCMRRSGYQGKKIGWSLKDQQAAMFISKVSDNSEKSDYSENSENSDYSKNSENSENSDYSDYSDNSGVTINYVFAGVKGSFSIPFVDDASVENAITTATVALYLGVSPDALAERMPQLEPVAMRLEVIDGRRGCTLINDSYNSDVNSLDIALDFMQRRYGGGTLILSDIYESGMNRHDLYRQVSDLLMKRGVKKFIGIGTDLVRAHATECIRLSDNIETHFFQSVEAFMGSEAFTRLRSEVILIKGARAFGFDRITDQLSNKVHETTLEVNLNTLVENLNRHRACLHPDTKMVCMIKADAYGAGAVEVAKTLQDRGVDYLAVAVADEGVTLRRAGVTANIMVMNPEMSSFKTLFDYRLEPEVYSFRLLDALILAARKEGITGWPVHIKLDTGMHRLGFDPATQLDELIDRLQHQQAVIPRSVFSHFVGSDSDRFDEFSTRQFEIFDQASKQLQTAFPHKILRHICNSAGILRFPERQLDMCRLGIGLYENVSALWTTILQLRHVPAGDSVGYSRNTVMERDSVIAAIPIGYADGLDRMMGNRHGCCVVNGQRAPYVGNICMDVALVDVTGIDCNEGDRVQVFGPDLTADEVAGMLGTISYEVLTSVSNRVKRVYFEE
ncbi:MAG: alanine racemase [Prevotella sp.]|nr:alanine racemase [Prevotella sp.]